MIPIKYIEKLLDSTPDNMVREYPFVLAGVVLFISLILYSFIAFQNSLFVNILGFLAILMVVLNILSPIENKGF